jgi:hypothetical protein
VSIDEMNIWNLERRKIMSYTNEIKDDNGQIIMNVHVTCKANPQKTYDRYHQLIKKQIELDDYIPKTNMDNLVHMIILSFDCDDNYGEYDAETGMGGYGMEFTLKECFRYVEESGGYAEFDYYC